MRNNPYVSSRGNGEWKSSIFQQLSYCWILCMGWNRQLYIIRGYYLKLWTIWGTIKAQLTLHIYSRRKDGQLIIILNCFNNNMIVGGEYVATKHNIDVIRLLNKLTNVKLKSINNQTNKVTNLTQLIWLKESRTNFSPENQCKWHLMKLEAH